MPLNSESTAETVKKRYFELELKKKLLWQIKLATKINNMNNLVYACFKTVSQKN